MREPHDKGLANHIDAESRPYQVRSVLVVGSAGRISINRPPAISLDQAPGGGKEFFIFHVPNSAGIHAAGRRRQVGYELSHAPVREQHTQLGDCLKRAPPLPDLRCRETPATRPQLMPRRTTPASRWPLSYRIESLAVLRLLRTGRGHPLLVRLIFISCFRNCPVPCRDRRDDCSRQD